MRFSVVTPSFRSSQWLKLCIRSVADQGVALEHIVQDNKSDDGTLDWLPHEPGVATFVEKDDGMYDAINRGLRRASGDILAYLNCDEQYLPGALQSVVKFFGDNPGIEVLFAWTVAVDVNGDYLFHRKVQIPQLYNTWLHPLSVLTCATFFRRSVIGNRGLLFNPAFRFCGDAEWVLRLLQQRVAMAILPQFTSCFTHTGQNLSLNPLAKVEMERLFASAPGFVRMLRKPILLFHRLRRVVGRVYFQAPFRYSIYTRDNLSGRTSFQVARPTGRWRW